MPGSRGEPYATYRCPRRYPGTWTGARLFNGRRPDCFGVRHVRDVTSGLYGRVRHDAADRARKRGAPAPLPEGSLLAACRSHGPGLCATDLRALHRSTTLRGGVRGLRAAGRPPDATSTLAPLRVLRGGVDPRGPLRRRPHGLVPLGFCRPQRRDRRWRASRPPPTSLCRVRHPLGSSGAMRGSVAGRAAVLPGVRAPSAVALPRAVARGVARLGNDRRNRRRHSRDLPAPAGRPDRLAGVHTSTARGRCAFAPIRRAGDQPDAPGRAGADRGTPVVGP